MGESDPNGLDQHQPGAKLDAGKPMAGLLGDFGLALLAVAEVGTFGAQKYTRGGWQSVPNGVDRYTDAAWRHLLKEHVEQRDDDSGLYHAAHLAWNSLARLELMLRDGAVRPQDGGINERSVGVDDATGHYCVLVRIQERA